MTLLEREQGEGMGPGWWTPGRQRIGAAPLPGLKRVRKERGLSIRQLADRAGGMTPDTRMSPDTIYRLEKGTQGAKADTRRRLAAALKTSQTELFTPDREEVNED